MRQKRNAKREVEIWSPTTEPKESLDARIAACQAQGACVIVYRSGRGNLASHTGDLLRHNKEIER